MSDDAEIPDLRARLRELEADRIPFAEAYAEPLRRQVQELEEKLATYTDFIRELETTVAVMTERAAQVDERLLRMLSQALRALPQDKAEEIMRGEGR